MKPEDIGKTVYVKAITGSHIDDCFWLDKPWRITHLNSYCHTSIIKSLMSSRSWDIYEGKITNEGIIFHRVYNLKNKVSMSWAEKLKWIRNLNKPTKGV